MKVMSVVGARPNFMKVAPIIAAIHRHNERARTASDSREVQRALGPILHVLVHTGQHYGGRMSDSFFADLNLPEPDIHLNAGSGSHAAQTAEIMKRFEDALLREKPEVLIVVGDVNSTLACALVASKIWYDPEGSRPMIAHVEAGLRSFDRRMPEEINRILTDHLSDLLFVTEESGLRNLIREGVPTDRVYFVGNTMIDSLFAYKDQADACAILDDLGIRNGVGGQQSVACYALLTLHRPANVDNCDAFLNILEGLQELAQIYPVVFPAHPRTQKRIEELGLARYFSRRSGGPGIRLIDPLGYLDFLSLMKNAKLVVTDSGGVQEETTCLGIPCVTLRENTERPVTIEQGTNILAGVKKDGIRRAVRQQLNARPGTSIPEKWDGKSAARILEVLSQQMSE
jgi:UDP-N-acetylglucosamine 2-epimerase (non-hydrolysing)